MMDAVEFAKEMKRMMEYSPRKDEICYDIKGIIRQSPEFAVRIVEEWSKAHPIQTNADKFKEVFGFEPYSDMAWAAANDEYAAELHDTAWWEKPYEAPKGADNDD